MMTKRGSGYLTKGLSSGRVKDVIFGLQLSIQGLTDSAHDTLQKANGELKRIILKAEKEIAKGIAAIMQQAQEEKD